MKLTDARYTYSDNYPILLVTIDGVPCWISSDKKPTMIRHGIVAGLTEIDSTADFLGSSINHASDDPRLFRLVVAFLLDCYHDRFEEGPASDALDLTELEAMGERLAPFVREGSPSWATVVANFWPIKALA